MANLSIKIPDSMKQAFNELCINTKGKDGESLTQPEMFERMFTLHSTNGSNANADATLQSEINRLNAVIMEMTTERERLVESHSTEVSTLEGNISTLESALALAEKEIEGWKVINAPDRDLTADIKELARVTILENAITNYVRSQARKAMRAAASITPDKAVEMFVKINGDK